VRQSSRISFVISVQFGLPGEKLSASRKEQPTQPSSPRTEYLKIIFETAPVLGFFAAGDVVGVAGDGRGGAAMSFRALRSPALATDDTLRFSPY
jgi:hypothetical protein